LRSSHKTVTGKADRHDGSQHVGRQHHVGSFGLLRVSFDVPVEAGGKRLNVLASQPVLLMLHRNALALHPDR
jgi:hypothetical protein